MRKYKKSVKPYFPEIWTNTCHATLAATYKFQDRLLENLLAA